MNFTTSKMEPAAVVAKKGLLRKLGGRVRGIYKTEKKACRSDRTVCQAQAEKKSSLAEQHVVHDETNVNSYGSSEPQARAPTTAALIGLLAQAARVLAEGLHDAKHQAKGNNNTCQRVSLASTQALVDQLKTEAAAADEADWMALTNWMKRWWQDEATKAAGYQEEALDRKADTSKYQTEVAKQQAEIAEMKLAISITKAENHNEVSDLEDERDDLQRQFDDLQLHVEALEAEWFELKAELERKLGVEKVQRAKNFRDAMKAKGESKALRKELAALKEKAERDLQDRQDTIDSLLPITQDLKKQLDELRITESAVDMVCELKGEVQSLRTNNQSAEVQVQALLDDLTKLRKEVAKAEDDAMRAEAERKAAVLEVGMVHLQNMCYRASLEDEDPARTAEIDGRLKRKDEDSENLRKQYNEAVRLLDAERKGRAFDREHFVGQKQVLEDQKVVLKKNLKSVRMNRDNLQQQNEEVFAMFKAKIFHDDVAKALAKDSEILRQDNVRLLSMSKKRECRLQKVIEETVTLKQKTAELEAATESMTEIQRHLQAETNGLELHKSRLEHAAEIETAVWEGERARLHDQINSRDKEIQRLIQDGCETSTWEELHTKEAEIVDLQKNLQQERSLAAQYFDQIHETRDGFCYVHDHDEIWNEKAADTRYRLRIAERENVRLQKLLDGQDEGQRGQEERYVPLTEGDGAYYGPRAEDESSDNTVESGLRAKDD